MLVTGSGPVDVRGRSPIDAYAQFLLLGLGAGAVYAAIALGLVLTYRASGVVNFAHGAVTMYATYVFVGLSVDGHLLLPLPGAAGKVHVGTLPTAAAAVVAVVAAALLEVGFYLVVFRPLRAAPALSRVVASVGLMVALQAIVTVQYGADSVTVPSILPADPVTWLGVTVPRDRLYVAAAVVVAAAALWAVYRFTPFGLASRACAEDERALALLGRSPDVIAAANWAAAGAVAALAGIFVGPITTLDPVTFTLLVVPALAAALAGGLSSFGATTAAALVLGMAQSELVRAQVDLSWLPAAGLGKTLPLVVVVAVAVVRGALLPPRAALLERRMPSVGRSAHPWPGVATLFVAGLVALVLTHGEYRLALTTSFIGAILCLSLVVLTGFLGQLSLAQMAFAGVTGFMLARLQHDAGVPFPVDVVTAVIAAALVGLLIGVPALRVRGPALALATLAGGVAVEALLFQDPRVTGGLAGSHVRAPSIAGYGLGPGGGGGGYPRLAFGVVALVVLCATAAGVARLRTHRLGRRLLAVRANERAAEAAGVALTSTKLIGFALSAALAGVAGAVIGWQQGQLSFGSFDVFVSLGYVALAYVGGIGRVSGAVIGGLLVSSGVVFTALNNAANLGRYQLFASGVAVVVIVVTAPDGVAGVAERGLRRLAAARARRT